MQEQEKIEKMMTWFNGLNEDQKSQVARHLFEHAVSTEWISIFCEDDAKDLAEETGDPIEKYLAPYFTSCGEPLID